MKININIHALTLSKKRATFSSLMIKMLLSCFLLIIVLSAKAQKQNPFGNALVPDMTGRQVLISVPGF